MSPFAVPRNDGESWLDATLRHAAQFGHSKLDVMGRFAAQLKSIGDEEQAAICTLLELDITPLRHEGVSGT